MPPDRPRRLQVQFTLARLLGSVAAISGVLMLLRLPTPASMLWMMLVGSLVCARLGQDYLSCVGLGMYGSMAGVWFAAILSPLVQQTWNFLWMEAFLASWLCMPLGACMGLVAGLFTPVASTYERVSLRLKRRETLPENELTDAPRGQAG